MKNGQSKVSLGIFNSMTNVLQHKPTDPISAVATRKTLVSNSWPCPWCGSGSRARSVGNRDSKKRVQRALQILLVLFLTTLTNSNLQRCQGKFSINTLIFLRLSYRMSHTPTGNQTSKMILSRLLHGPVLPFRMTKRGTVISLATAEHTPLPGSLTTSTTGDS